MEKQSIAGIRALAAGFLGVCGLSATAMAQEEPFVEDTTSYEETSYSEPSTVTVTGWLDTIFKYDTKQHGKTPYIDVAHIYLIFDGKLDETWSMFFETEWEHLPEHDGDAGKGYINVDRAYLEGNFSQVAKMRFGKFRNPFGLRIPEHWLVLAPVLEKPIHESAGYVPGEIVGLESVGSFVFGRAGRYELSYSAYWTNGVETDGTGSPEDGLYGWGGDLNLRLYDDYLVGASYYHQKNPGIEDRNEDSFIGYADAELPANFKLRAELFRQQRNKGFDPATTWNAMIQYRFHNHETWAISYRHDQGDDDSAGGNMHFIHAANLAWRVTPAVRFVLAGSAHRFDAEAAENYEKAIFWAGATF